MKSVISIGNQDFVSIRKNHCFYIDKTDFIREWWDKQDSVTLITRPRRFGKTLNMSMTEYFFSVNHADCKRYFEGLSIWEEERFRKLQGTYPVISISFADVKATTYESARRAIIRKLVKLYSTFEFVRSSEVLNEKDHAYFDSVEENMSDDAAAVAVNYMSDYLSRYYKKKVIILLDEYDTPLQEAYIHGYWKSLTGFIRSLFNSTFKTNPYMERGLLIGITRVSKESIFSDLNNLEVVTTTSEKYSSSFGFTKEEVFHVLETSGLSEEKETVCYWYDGFSFGKRKDIYNPWSITKYLDTGEYGTYWADTSGNALISTLIRQSPAKIKSEMEDLLNGGVICTELDEQVIFEQLGRKRGAVWSLMLASGYLKVDRYEMDKRTGKRRYYLNCGHFTDCRCDWRHEHHAGVRHRTHAGSGLEKGTGRKARCDFGSVPDRGICTDLYWRFDWCNQRSGSGEDYQPADRNTDGDQHSRHAAGGAAVHCDWRHFRCDSGCKGGKSQSD